MILVLSLEFILNKYGSCLEYKVISISILLKKLYFVCILLKEVRKQRYMSQIKKELKIINSVPHKNKQIVYMFEGAHFTKGQRRRDISEDLIHL